MQLNLYFERYIMFAKITLFLLICIFIIALFSGLKRIYNILTKKICGCEKTGGSVCHCDDKDDNSK